MHYGIPKNCTSTQISCAISLKTCPLNQISCALSLITALQSKYLVHYLLKLRLNPNILYNISKDLPLKPNILYTISNNCTSKQISCALSLMTALQSKYLVHYLLKLHLNPNILCNISKDFPLKPSILCTISNKKTAPQPKYLVQYL